MPSIEEKAFQNYQDNMEYFNEKHPSLYSKLKAFEILLENGTLEQKYDLEYKNDNFDVIDLRNKNYLYQDTSSSQYSKQLTKDVNFKKNDHVCETFYNLDFTEEAVQKAIESDAITLFSTTAPIISYYKEYTNSTMHFKKVYKFMFFGTGLGLHIPSIITKTQAEVVLFIEKDLELFRLSLFTCNYKQSLSQSIAFFSIAENDIEEHNTIEQFYLTSIVYNQYLKFSLFSLHYEQYIKTIQTYILSRPEKAYSHERILYKNKKVLEKIKEKYNFFDLSKKENELFFHDKPVLVVGAGPSLQKNIDWLYKNQNKFLIISVFAALKTLQKQNIIPDIVIQLDEKINPAVELINSFDNFDFIKDAVFLFSASVPDIFFETFHKNQIFLVEDRTTYKQDKLYIRASSVGEFAYSLALIYNAQKTYLLGLDLALSEDGLTHADDHHWSSKLDTSKTENIDKVASLQNTTLPVKGNFRDNVVTTPLFMNSISKLNEYTQMLKTDHQSVYNLSDGAYFTDVTPLLTKDLKISTNNLNKSKLHKELNSLFKKYSSAELSYNETLFLKKRYKQIDSYYNFSKQFKESNTLHESDFANEYKKLILNIINTEVSELRELLIVYIYNTAPYIIDFFNTKELKNSKRHTKKLKGIVLKQFIKIIQYYKEEVIKQIL